MRSDTIPATFYDVDSLWRHGHQIQILLIRYGCGSWLHIDCNNKEGFNTLWTIHNSHHFADDIFKCIFLNENLQILNKISLKFVPKGPVNDIPALVQIMAWPHPGDKPLSEPMMFSLLMHICTQPQ